jgi:hypothetical protein
MNDADIELIISLIAGDLPPEEAAAARARIEASNELGSAYDEQLAVVAIMHDAPTASMTAEEQGALHARLRNELRLDRVSTPSAVPARRWWLALGGLATAAAVVFAFAVVPNLLDNNNADVVSAPATEPTAELDTLSNGEAEAFDEPTTTAPPSDSAGADTTEAPATTLPLTTTAATEETATTTATTETAAEEPVYFLSPVSARSTTFNLPVLDEAVVTAGGLEAAIAAATEFATLPLATLAACFSGEQGTGDIAVTPAGIDAAASEVYATATDVASGARETITIDLETCTVTGGG